MQRLTLALAFTSAMLAPLPAYAGGTVTVQQVDGSIQRYPGSTMYVEKGRLRLTSPDKKGTLIISDAACSYVEQLLRCLPYTSSLRQDGSHPISLQQGTIYFNTSGQTQTLKYSSTQVPPKGVYGTVRTVHGTYVTIVGTLDGGGR